MELEVGSWKSEHFFNFALLTFKQPTLINMSNKTRSLLKGVAVILVLIAVFIQMDYISIRYVDANRFWLVVTGFGLLLVGSR